MRAQPTFATLASGLKLHYRVQGNPEGPWVVLLNGLLSDTTMWDGAPSAIERSEERERRTKCPARSGGSQGPHSEAQK
jgi:pimeloyl-ACP methyl ester carboxylesterase